MHRTVQRVSREEASRTAACARVASTLAGGWGARMDLTHATGDGRDARRRSQSAVRDSFALSPPTSCWRATRSCWPFIGYGRRPTTRSSRAIQRGVAVATALPRHRRCRASSTTKDSSSPVDPDPSHRGARQYSRLRPRRRTCRRVSRLRCSDHYRPLFAEVEADPVRRRHPCVCHVKTPLRHRTTRSHEWQLQLPSARGL